MQKVRTAYSKKETVKVSHPWNRLLSNLLNSLILEVGKPKFKDIN